MKISEVISYLKAFHPPVDEEHTCDVVKIGDEDQECKGIVITAFASTNVIKKTAELGANLIITHEPVFYTNADNTGWLENNSVYKEKERLILENGIVVWRDHDRIHGGGNPFEIPASPDLIFCGIMKTLGWEEYLTGDSRKPLEFEIPETTVGELTEEICSKLNLNGARIIGRRTDKVTKVFLCEHITEGRFDGRDIDSEKIAACEEKGHQVLIPFEIIDWTLSEYVRDAVEQGKVKAIIEVGHFNMEEAGMKYMASWLPAVLDYRIPVHFVQSGDAFDYYVKNS